MSRIARLDCLALKVAGCDVYKKGKCHGKCHGQTRLVFSKPTNFFHLTTLHLQPPTSTFHLHSTTINMSDNNSSTLGSYVNQATGMAQRAFGAVTGDSSAQVHIMPHLYPLSFNF